MSYKPPLTEGQILELRILYLTDPDITLSILGERFDRTPSAIGRYLTGPDYDQMRDTIHGSMAGQARDILGRGAEQAAILWSGKTLARAADKGDHRPMRDLLLAVGAIKAAAEDAPPLTIQIGVSLTDVHVQLLPESPVKQLTPVTIDAEVIPAKP